MTRPRHLIAAAIGILLLLAPSLAARTIYGDREPVELLYPERPQGVEGWSGMYFDAWGENQDAAIFVHVPGDSMSNMFSLAAYGMSLRELDRRARDEGVVFFWNENAPNPALAIAARDLETLTDALERNRGLTDEWSRADHIRGPLHESGLQRYRSAARRGCTDTPYGSDHGTRRPHQ